MSLYRHRISESVKIPSENVITTVDDHYRRNSIRDLSATGLTSRKSIILARDLATSAAADEEICLYLFIGGSVSIRDGNCIPGDEVERWSGVKGLIKVGLSLLQSLPIDRRRAAAGFVLFFLFSFFPSFTCVAILFSLRLLSHLSPGSPVYHVHRSPFHTRVHIDTPRRRRHTVDHSRVSSSLRWWRDAADVTTTTTTTTTQRTCVFVDDADKWDLMLSQRAVRPFRAIYTAAGQDSFRRAVCTGRLVGRK